VRRGPVCEMSPDDVPPLAGRAGERVEDPQGLFASRRVHIYAELHVCLEARGVHKLGRVPDPADFQGDRISAPHALAVTSEGDNPRKLDGLATER
jgi:hypothetical protein